MSRIFRSSEHYEQAMLVKWWRQTQPDMLFAIPNGGARNKAQAGKLKAEGVLPGVHDLFAPERHLWIEMKRTHDGSLSKEQRAFGLRMLAAGYRVIVAWGCADAIEQIENGERMEWQRKKTGKGASR